MLYADTLADMLGSISPFQWQQIQHIHPGPSLKLLAKPLIHPIVKAKDRVVQIVQLTHVPETIVGDLARHVGMIKGDGLGNRRELLDVIV